MYQYLICHDTVSQDIHINSLLEEKRIDMHLPNSYERVSVCYIGMCLVPTVVSTLVPVLYKFSQQVYKPASYSPNISQAQFEDQTSMIVSGFRKDLSPNSRNWLVSSKVDTIPTLAWSFTICLIPLGCYASFIQYRIPRLDPQAQKSIPVHHDVENTKQYIGVGKLFFIHFMDHMR